ncbi:hypothetical protein ES705_39557 [subsurface metagenome]
MSFAYKYSVLPSGSVSIVRVIVSPSLYSVPTVADAGVSQLYFAIAIPEISSLADNVIVISSACQIPQLSAEQLGSVKSNVTVVFPKPVFPTKSVAETLTVLFPSSSVPCTV